MSNELQISSTKLESMSSSQLEKFAEEKSKFILEKIELSTQKVADAKYAAEAANSMRSGWFGKTRKKADATANAVIETNEAIAEMNELLQESIRFTCLSLSFAQAMSKHMSALIVQGFKNRDGEFIRLSADSEEQARYIIQQAEAFANNQLEVERKQAAQDSKIDTLAGKISKNETRLNEKDKIDAEQTQRLEELGALLSNKDLVDQKQEEAIKVLFEYTKQKDILDKQQSEEIEKLRKKRSPALLIITFILALLSFLISLGTAFLCLPLL